MRLGWGAVALLGMLAACPDDVPSPGESQSKPYRDEWKLEIAADFDYLAEDGAVQIGSIQIGGPVFQDNFENRGDVIVQFHDEDKILVEVRRFTSAKSEAGAKEDFDDLLLYASNGTSLVPVKSIPAENDCSTVWLEGCQIRIYYDGMTQPARSGADLRVTLPRAFRHEIGIYTRDNIESDDYLNRGNVCVDGVNASVDVELGSGTAFIKLAADTTPMPRCTLSEALYESCVSGEPETHWVEQDGDDGCGCITQIGEFGRAKVESHDAASANVTVDVPEGLWADLNLINEQSGQIDDGSPACEDGSTDGARCDACVFLPDFEIIERLMSDEARPPWENRGAAGKPNDAVTAGAGYSIALTSKSCETVSFTENPNDYGEAQDSEERGNLTVCQGCLADQTCEQLIGS